MKYFALLMMVGSLSTALAYNNSTDKYCHDTETGRYRRIRPNDNPRPMKPHSGRPEFHQPHLECNPQR